MNIFNNLKGLFKLDDRICYAEYAGQDILYREQFKIYFWLGKDSEDSWDGHLPWDYDSAVIFEFGRGLFFEGPIYGGGYDHSSDQSISDNYKMLELENHETFQDFPEESLGQFLYLIQDRSGLITEQEIEEHIEKSDYKDMLKNKYQELGLVSQGIKDTNT